MQAPGQPDDGEGVAAEQHYTVLEIAHRWGWSAKTAARVFQSEPGVLVLDRPETRYKRGYCTLTIPASVAERVHRRMERK